ncbi:hypothetical protein BP6252_10990 [Coleophoma cylindrospora]|uniref:Major facilitator superfamily (MFS) profile domain-containing protein n=1 Tax=Coleophoma cylindrospora TaxID=1849047 RepID=A0A3D8QNR2_9HELO|nr:hypothetical protein BP6252_10990 [Coleophoma cylindrospora]
MFSISSKIGYSRGSISSDGPLVSGAEIIEVDIVDPRNWPKRTKVFMSLGGILAVFVATLGNSMYIGSVNGVQEHFHISLTLALSPITFYSLGFSFGPLVATATSEVFGRAIVYRTAIAVALIFTVVSASAHSFATLAVGRFLAGAAVSPCLGATVAMLNDLWDLHTDKVGIILSIIWGLSLIWAACLGPLIGEAIVQRTENWRWSMWLIAILLGVTSLCLLRNHETYMPEILRRDGKRRGQAVLPRGNLGELLYVSIGRPLHMLLVEPIIFPTALLVAFSQAILFVFYVAYPLMLTTVYSFTPIEIGCAFLPMLIGTFCAFGILGVFNKKAQESTKPRQLEHQLYPAMIGSIMQPVALFWLAWSARPSVHWIAPLLSGLFYGCAFVLVQYPFPMYKVLVYGKEYGASISAVDISIRYLLSSVCPLFTVQMVKRLTFAWAMSLLAFISLLMLPVPWVILKWGPELRARSKYMAKAKDHDNPPNDAKATVITDCGANDINVEASVQPGSANEKV